MTYDANRGGHAPGHLGGDREVDPLPQVDPPGGQEDDMTVVRRKTLEVERLVVRAPEGGGYAEITPREIALCDAQGHARVSVALEGDFASIQLLDYPVEAQVGLADLRLRAEIALDGEGDLALRLRDGAGRVVVARVVPGEEEQSAPPRPPLRLVRPPTPARQ